MSTTKYRRLWKKGDWRFILKEEEERKKVFGQFKTRESKI